jgi:hypothetical protein
VQLADGQESRRDIPEAHCSEVLSSMTVIAAMILDGGGLDDPAPTAPSSDEFGGSAASAAVDAPAWAPPRRAFVETAESGTKGPSARSRTQLAALAGLGPQSGVAPVLVPRLFAGLGLVFEAAESPNRDDSAAQLSPSVDVTASFAEGQREVIGYGTARFRLLAITLTICPLRWPLSARFALRPCLPVELGVLRGMGENTEQERTQHMPWLGAGPALRIEASLSRALLLELEAHGTVLAREDRFVFEPDQIAHDVSRVVFGLRAAAVVRAP